MTRNLNKSYKPKHLQSPYADMFIFVLLLSPIILFNIFYQNIPGKIIIISTIAVFGGMFVLYLYMKHYLMNNIIVTITENKIIGYNHFKKQKNEIEISKIEEIYATKGTYYIILKDKEGTEFKTSLPLIAVTVKTYTDENGNLVKEETGYDNYEILMNELLDLAENVKKIDLRSIKQKYPRIKIYEKGLE